MAPAADSPARTLRRYFISWQLVVPVLAVAAVVLTWGWHPPAVVEVLVVALLAGSVLAAVHHAEVVAHRVGEPFGSLVLAVAVTVIEVSLIVTLIVAGGSDTATLARDTVFAAVMITCNGIVGLSLVIGARRRGMAVFQSEGTTGPLATVATLATLCLVLPSFTTSSPEPTYSPTQLAFAAVASLVLYGLFVFVQTIGYRDYFLPPVLPDHADAAHPTAAPTPRRSPSTRRRLPAGRPRRAWACWWRRWWVWSGWRRWSHPRSARSSRPRDFPHPSSVW